MTLLSQIVTCFYLWKCARRCLKDQARFVYFFRAFFLQFLIKAYGSKQHKNVHLWLKSINCVGIKRKKPSNYEGMELYSITWYQAKISHFGKLFPALHRSPNKAQFDLYFPVPKILHFQNHHNCDCSWWDLHKERRTLAVVGRCRDHHHLCQILWYCHTLDSQTM